MIPRRTRTMALAVVFALPIAAATAPLAQEGPPPDDRGGPRMSDQEADDLHETLEIYMLARMKRALGLSREQEETIVPLVQDLSESRRRFNRERRLVMTRLFALAQDPSAGEDEIRRALERMDGNEKSFREQEASSLRSIRSALTIRQQAQFVVFRERFRREMMERLRSLREEGPGGRPPAGPGRRGGRLR